ncbi:neuronal acetylcholine receptor subunit alpha-7 isoform X2 [Nematostella vectensis]|uniref:neuronal acetylcholine receptor subunit alpha-7 isoform X2 n=1 Tax=Nematostella vectensis TaxID=45351 RepID=UPI0013902D33|nr:neuronal acetylcholine receptor subunit alpha-7 isoform X2 [Nematostella vectensis]
MWPLRVLLMFSLLNLIEGFSTLIPQVDRDEEHLMEHLFRNYKPQLRPVISKTHNITVKFGISLHQIFDVHEKNQVLKIGLWVRQSWYNPFLVWNASEFGGIRSINVDPKMVWTPDLYLYNNADERDDGAMDRFRTKIVLSDTGQSKWLAPIILSSSCKIDVKYFPFDAQACDFKFGSWTYDGFKLDIIMESDHADTKKFVSNGEWDLVSFHARRNELYYVCCDEPYPDVTYTLKIRRRSMYYYVNIIIPCVLITALSLMSFYLPPDSGERIALVITNLLALTVFMLLVAEILPSSSEVVPLISIYYTCTIIEVGIALVATCIVLKFYFHDPNLSDMSPCVRLVVLGWLARLLRINVKQRKLDFKRRSSCLPKTPSLLDDKDADLSTETTTLFEFPPNGLCLGNGDARRIHPETATAMFSRNHQSSMHPKQEENLKGSHEFHVSSTNAPCCCHCNFQEPMNRMLGSQNALLHSVYRMVRKATHRDSISDQKYEWILAASIIDKVFFMVFLFLLCLSTFVLFAQGSHT